MKTTKLIRCAFCAAVLVVFALVGCEETEIYSIDAPSDLQDKIDSIAAAKAAKDTGDTTYIDLSTTIVGESDFSSTWWTVWSDYFTVPTNKFLHLEFVNNTTCATTGNNWENWVLVTANMEAHSTTDDADYKEYFALRADAYGWGGLMANEDEDYTYDGGYISHDYADAFPGIEDDDWSGWRSVMDGAYVTLEIDHSATGNAYVSATMVTTDGTVLTETFQNGVSATDDIIVFLACEISYLEMKVAYLIPSQVTVEEDSEPVLLSISGTPSAVEVGSDNFWGNGIATVTFADGSSTEVDTADLSFSYVDDMASVGEKTVVVAYSYTKLGEFTSAVSTYYDLEVINAVSSLEVTTLPDVTSYTFPGSAAPVVDVTGLVVTATYSDESTGVIANENLQFVNPGGNGTQNVVVTYVGTTGTVTTTFSITNVTGGTNQVGPTDFASTWWASFSNEYTVTSGSTKTFTMDCYSSGENNWNAPLVVLRDADLTEYAVLRMDNFGWGDGYGTATLSNDWDWDVFAANINGSSMVITVTNVGDGTANVRYDVTYSNGDTHYQLYEGITVDSSDLNSAITIDGCYVDITSVE